MKALFFVSILGLTGCYGTDGRVFIEDQFSVEETRVLREAIDAWNEAADAQLMTYAGTFAAHHAFDFQRDYEGPHESIAIHKVSAHEAGFGELVTDIDDHVADEFCGIANVDYGRMVLVLECLVTMTNDETRALAMHEMGHLLGLHDDQGIMSNEGHLDLVPCVDDHSLRLLCEEHECGPQKQEGC
jgi:hypothetical protein